MAAADKKTTYTAAEVAELLRTLNQSIQALQEENADLKRKLEHMNEVFANAQRARFGQSSEQKNYVLGKDQLSLFNEAEEANDDKAEEPNPDTVPSSSPTARLRAASWNTPAPSRTPSVCGKAGSPPSAAAATRTKSPCWRRA